MLNLSLAEKQIQSRVKSGACPGIMNLRKMKTHHESKVSQAACSPLHQLHGAYRSISYVFHIVKAGRKVRA